MAYWKEETDCWETSMQILIWAMSKTCRTMLIYVKTDRLEMSVPISRSTVDRIWTLPWCYMVLRCCVPRGSKSHVSVQWMSAIHTSTFVVEVHASWSIRFIMASPIKQNEHVKIGSLLKPRTQGLDRFHQGPVTPKETVIPVMHQGIWGQKKKHCDGRCLQLLHGPHFVELCQPILQCALPCHMPNQPNPF